MNTFTQTLSTLFSSFMRVVIWLVAGLFALTVTAMIMVAMLLAGLFALLTGRRAWWSQLRQANRMRSAWQRAAQGGGGFQGGFGTGSFAAGGFGPAFDTASSADAEVKPAAESTPSVGGPLARRRFGRNDVSDVKPRDTSN